MPYEVAIEPTLLQLIVAFTVIFITFIAGIIHEVFWILSSLLCFYAASVLTVLFPNTMWALAMVGFGMILLVLSVARIAGNREYVRSYRR